MPTTLASGVRRTGPPINLLIDAPNHSTLDLWAPSREQKAYYLAQFIRLQQDPRAKLTGSQAKPFFELSKLSNEELCNIWELSDVDHDGQLSLEEFCIAMHLVVLRRNGVPTPSCLPPSLLETVYTPNLSIAPQATVSTNSLVVVAPSLPLQSSPGEPSAKLAHHPGRWLSPPTSSHFPTCATPPPNSTVPQVAVTARQRRWSVSSQSDISASSWFESVAIAEGIRHFETTLSSKKNQIQHPIPRRPEANPSDATTLKAVMASDSQFTSEVKSIPPPPPRRSLVTASDATQLLAVSVTDPLACDLQAPEWPQVDADAPDRGASANEMSLADVSAYMQVQKLQRECDQISKANEELANELMHLQHHRIALKTILERLKPLDAPGEK